jgi:hypothetical protein
MEPLVRDPRTRKLTFTGSTPVGRTLVEQSATQLLRTSMEVGGNAPFIVFDPRTTSCHPRRPARQGTGEGMTDTQTGLPVPQTLQH